MIHYWHAWYDAQLKLNCLCSELKWVFEEVIEEGATLTVREDMHKMCSDAGFPDEKCPRYLKQSFKVVDAGFGIQHGLDYGYTRKTWDICYYGEEQFVSTMIDSFFGKYAAWADLKLKDGQTVKIVLNIHDVKWRKEHWLV